jgi:hypothetical protein
MMARAVSCPDATHTGVWCRPGPNTVSRTSALMGAKAEIREEVAHDNFFVPGEFRFVHAG